jgi:signal peptidase II
MRGKIILLIIISFILTADVITKLLIIKNIPLYGHLEILPFLNITHISNPGVAFGMLSQHNNTVIRNLIILVYIIAIVMLIILLINDYSKKLCKYGYTLIIAGAAGNLLDRIRMGHVIDFIDFHIGSIHYPSFNVADSSITIGIGLIIVDVIFFNKR